MSCRVLMIAFTDYPADTRVRREAEALVARGDSVDVVCPQTETIGDRRDFGGVRVHPTGSLSQDKPLQPLAYVRRDVRFLLQATWKALRLHLRRRYDVVHVHTMPDYLVAAALLPKLFGARVLLDIHDLVPELYTSKFGVSEDSRIIRLAKLVERRCVAIADRAIAVHDPHLDALVEHGNPREAFAVVMNSPDARIFARRSEEPATDDGFVVVYHGTISRRHGLETAVRAVGLARARFPDIRLQICGVGEDVQRLRGIVEELELGEAVSIRAEMRPVEELMPVLTRANAGVVPIGLDPFTRYMLPVKLLEYVALGVPVVCSRTPSIEAYFDESMLWFFTPGDERELADALVRLRVDADSGRERAARADAFLERHSWQQEAQRYYAVIDSLAARSPKGRITRAPAHALSGEDE